MSKAAGEKEGLAHLLLQRILLDAYLEKARDIHLEPLRDGEMLLRYRLEDALLDIKTLGSGVSGELLRCLKKTAGLDIDTHPLPRRGTFTMGADEIEEGMILALKMGVLPTLCGERITISMNPFSDLAATSGKGFESLGFAGEDLQKAHAIFNKPSGLIVIAGTTGSGKTTTCHSALHHIRKRRQGRALIICLEESPAYPMDGMVQVKVEPSAEGKGYRENLQAALWQDPDVIFLDSVPDRETARMVMEATMAGHLVIVQVESPDIFHALPRLMALTGDPSLLASMLEGAMAQRLVRSICTECREAYRPSHDITDRYFLTLYQNLSRKRLNPSEAEQAGRKESVTLYRGKGCMHCHDSGFSGRTGLYEILEPDMEIRDLLKGGHEQDRLKEALIEKGFLTLREKALMYALAGITTLEEALRVSYA